MEAELIFGPGDGEVINVPSSETKIYYSACESGDIVRLKYVAVYYRVDDECFAFCDWQELGQ